VVEEHFLVPSQMFKYSDFFNYLLKRNNILLLFRSLLFIIFIPILLSCFFSSMPVVVSINHTNTNITNLIGPDEIEFESIRASISPKAGELFDNATQSLRSGNYEEANIKLNNYE
jgi:hypothetical protein